MQSIGRVHTRLIVKKIFSNLRNDQLLGFGNTSINQDLRGLSNNKRLKVLGGLGGKGFELRD